MYKKKNWVGIILLWLMFLSLAGIIAFVSFQSGTDTKEIGKQIINYIAQLKYPNGQASASELQQLTYEFRQILRIIAFFALGIMGTVTIHVSCKKCSWIIKTGVASMILIAIAYFTEKLKVYIPSRHYSYDEMILSITAVIGGFALVSLLTFAIGALKGFFRLITAAH